MSEEEHPQTELTRDIEVKKIDITSKIVNKGGFLTKERPSPDNFRGLLTKELLLSEALLSLDSEQPTPDLAKGIDVARDYINTLRTRFGLIKVDPHKMETLFLSKEKFNVHYKKLAKVDDVTSMAFATDVINPVVISTEDEIPKYFTASVGFHELIHKWLESSVRVYASEKTADNDTFRLFSEDRRSGLKVSKLKRTPEGIQEVGEVGSLLNELPNYLLQKVYIDDLLGKNEYRDVFPEEARQRKEKLYSLMGENNNYLIVTFEGGREVIFHRSNIHFDSNGNLMLERNTVPFLAMQLASDINTICDDIDGRPFWEVFLQAKLNPAIQNKLKESMDSKIGNGFYHRLKSAEYKAESMLSILTEVQDKLYIRNTSQNDNNPKNTETTT